MLVKPYENIAIKLSCNTRYISNILNVLNGMFLFIHPKKIRFLKWNNIVNENLPARKCNLILTTVWQNLKNLNVGEKIFLSWNFSSCFYEVFPLILFSPFLCPRILCKVVQSSYVFYLLIFHQVAKGMLLVMSRAVLMLYVQYWHRACHVHRLLPADSLIYRKQLSTTRIVTETSGFPQHNLQSPIVFAVWISLPVQVGRRKGRGYEKLWSV